MQLLQASRFRCGKAQHSHITDLVKVQIVAARG